MVGRHGRFRKIRDGVVGTATRYRMDGPGIESQLEARFSARVQTVPRAHPVSCTIGTGSFPGLKQPRRDVDHPLLPSAEVKERVELYIYSPPGLHDLFFTFTFT